ncbi:MAG: hypothetical protein M1358_23955 [Chloroflexi bacterium]|nr:hypothetical protein [Chloroflexota bacterium]
MANLYLIDLPFGQNGLELARLDSEAKIVLIQDGVYLGTQDFGSRQVYAVKKDVEKRGVAGRLPQNATVIDYGELVDLIVDNKVINFV